MIDFLRRIKADFLLSSVLCIALGLVFIGKPRREIKTFCQTPAG